MKLTPEQILSLEVRSDTSPEVRSLLAHIHAVEAERDAAVKGLRTIKFQSDCVTACSLADAALKSAGAEP